MKRLFAFFLVLFIVSLGQAAITAHQSNSSEQDSAKTVSGEVVSVDSDKNELVIKDKAGAEVRLVVNESTKFTKGDKTISLADLKAGEKVTCEAAESEGKWVAKSIQVATE
jgi:Cu/Ag efflux protein CusF